MFVKECSIHRSRAKYIWEKKKTNKLQVHPYKPVSWSPTGRPLTKSPDEWATTKQACRNELVVYLFFFSHICVYLRIYCCCNRNTMAILLSLPFLIDNCFLFVSFFFYLFCV